jgi:hypothetical protein
MHRISAKFPVSQAQQALVPTLLPLAGLPFTKAAA